MWNHTLVICALLSIIIVFVVLIKPLFIDKQLNYVETESKSLEFNESLSLLEAIAEYKTDYQMGKISKADFDEISLEFKRKYLEKRSDVEKK